MESIDSITPSFPNTSSLTDCRWRHLTKIWRTVSIHWKCSHWGGRSSTKIELCVKNAWPIRERPRIISTQLTAYRMSANLPRQSLFAPALFHSSCQLKMMYLSIWNLRFVCEISRLAWGKFKESLLYLTTPLEHIDFHINY